jgi:thiamine biosynthesis lipoprotein
MAIMGTIVTIEIVGVGSPDDFSGGIDRAFGWFAEVEKRCSRFDPESELRRLWESGQATSASELLFSAVEFALEVARETRGAFDPAVGTRLEARGINREYRSGLMTASGLHAGASYEDVMLDRTNRTIAFRQPLVLDLGAVAKGLAIDLAARELQPFTNFAIDAGGDLFLAGRNAAGEPWSAGIRHPVRDREVLDVVRVSDMAVCTSGNYERQHLIDPRVDSPAAALSSATVIAPTAMLADALATAAFVLGPARGIALLERHGVDGALWTTDFHRHATSGYEAFLSHA